LLRLLAESHSKAFWDVKGVVLPTGTAINTERFFKNANVVGASSHEQLSFNTTTLDRSEVQEQLQKFDALV
jgi:hypothetical protein